MLGRHAGELLLGAITAGREDRIFMFLDLNDSTAIAARWTAASRVQE